MIDLFDALFNIEDVTRRAQETLNAATATAENEIVTVTINGNGQVQAVVIKDETTDTPTLQSALIDAINNAILMSQQLSRATQLNTINTMGMWLADDDEDDDDEWPDDDDQ